jgi:hypothetical protein
MLRGSLSKSANERRRTMPRVCACGVRLADPCEGCGRAPAWDPGPVLFELLDKTAPPATSRAVPKVACVPARLDALDGKRVEFTGVPHA